LRVRLLDRTPRGIEPTIYAEAILRRGTIVFDELRSGIRDIEFLTDPAGGQVRIACSDMLAGGILAPVTGTFSKSTRRSRSRVCSRMPSGGSSSCAHARWTSR
jgi:DNA-binding transcriptional LysR family regulator